MTKFLGLTKITDEMVFKSIQALIAFQAIIGGAYILSPFYEASEMSALPFELGEGFGLSLYAILYLIGGLGLLYSTIRNHNKATKFFLLWCVAAHVYLVSLTIYVFGLRPLTWLARLIIALIALLLRMRLVIK